MTSSLAASGKTNLLISTKKRRKWTDDETEIFLKCFMHRQHEFLSRKKIFAYKNVLKDMFAEGFKDQKVTQSHLESKMKSLYKAYRTFKDNDSAKASNCIAPFLQELEIIFEDQPDSLAQPGAHNTEINKLIKSENDFGDYEMDSFTQSDVEDPLQEEQKYEKQTKNSSTANVLDAQESNFFENNVTTNTTKNTNSAQQEYYEAKLEFKRRDLAMKAKFYGEMKNLFKEKFQREEAMENKKLQLLAKIADKLCKQ